MLVVDLELPGRDGWEVLQLVRRAGGERDLRVAVLAGAPGHRARPARPALEGTLALACAPARAPRLAAAPA